MKSQGGVQNCHLGRRVDDKQAGLFLFSLNKIFLMNTGGAFLSEGCIRELYTLNHCEIKQPIVQLIDFEESETNDKEITIRISDGVNFLDCTLSGNYEIAGNCICETKNAATLISFRRLHIVKIIDYFSKLDETRICRLKVIIRKIAEISPAVEVVGSPQEIQQFMLKSKKQIPRYDQQTLFRAPQETTTKKVYPRQMERASGTYEETSIKIENVCENQYISPPNIAQTNNAHNYKTPTQLINGGTVVKAKKEISNFHAESQPQGLGEPLTLQEILSGKEGFLIGRLIRFKKTKKETKDGPMTVCYLGVLDRNYELIRIHLAGRLAMNNQKTLQKFKCYYIRGFDLVNVKSTGLQIRLKDKEYKILQIHNEDYIKALKSEYYHWDHEHDIENEYLDVIGIVDDIQEKTSYNPNNPNDNKSVIRVVLRNKYKCVKISFWSDQMKTLDSFNLKKKEGIIIQDVRKKQSKYYDFGFESSLIRLSEHPFLMERYQDILPEPANDVEPQNIRELSKIYEEEPTNSKLRTISAYLTHCHENNIVYRLCDECKKKVERHATECHECGSENLVFKYNCRLEFSDSTGSIICILFDTVAFKLIGRSANEISELQEDQIEQVFEPLYYKMYLLTIEDRNQRIIMRSIETLSQDQEVSQVRQNLARIYQNLGPSELWGNGVKL